MYLSFRHLYEKCDISIILRLYYALSNGKHALLRLYYKALCSLLFTACIEAIYNWNQQNYILENSRGGIFSNDFLYSPSFYFHRYKYRICFLIFFSSRLQEIFAKGCFSIGLSLIQQRKYSELFWFSREHMEIERRHISPTH